MRTSASPTITDTAAVDEMVQFDRQAMRAQGGGTSASLAQGGNRQFAV
jgi:hypothetical protein